MNINKISDQLYLTPEESKNVKDIDKSLKQLGYQFSYEVKEKKDEDDCAKIIYEQKIIELKPDDGYDSIIHELLHAKYEYLEDLSLRKAYVNSDKLGKRTFPHKYLEDFRWRLNNDFHHAIFYQEFQKLTKHIEEPKFISDYEDMTNASVLEEKELNIKIDYYKNKRGRFIDAFLHFYSEIYQKLFYRKLLLGEEHQEVREKLHEELPQYMEAADTLFSILEMKVEDLTQEKIDEVFVEFCEKLNEELKRPKGNTNYRSWI